VHDLENRLQKKVKIKGALERFYIHPSFFAERALFPDSFSLQRSTIAFHVHLNYLNRTKMKKI